MTFCQKCIEFEKISNAFLPNEFPLAHNLYSIPLHNDDDDDNDDPSVVKQIPIIARIAKLPQWS